MGILETKRDFAAAVLLVIALISYLVPIMLNYVPGSEDVATTISKSLVEILVASFGTFYAADQTPRPSGVDTVFGLGRYTVRFVIVVFGLFGVVLQLVLPTFSLMSAVYLELIGISLGSLVNPN